MAVRRTFSREFKLSAVEQLGSKSLARVARELDVNENLVRRWKKEFRLHASAAFLGNGNHRSVNSEADLERKIGQMTLEIDFLKKALRRVEEHRRLENAGGSSRSLKRSSKK